MWVISRFKPHPTVNSKNINHAKERCKVSLQALTCKVGKTAKTASPDKASQRPSIAPPSLPDIELLLGLVWQERLYDEVTKLPRGLLYGQLLLHTLCYPFLHLGVGGVDFNQPQLPTPLQQLVWLHHKLLWKWREG